MESVWRDDETGDVNVALATTAHLNTCQVCGAVSALEFCASCGAEQRAPDDEADMP
jgi:recombinational DNA repair protein RecR